ncbi:MAG: sigma 54-interacting transcriptional regulator [Myxococcales bacterium]
MNSADDEPESHAPEQAITGLSTLMLEAPDGPHAMVRQLALVVLDGNQKGTRFVAPASQFAIGSAKGAPICLEDPTVSRFHCELSVVGNEVHVRDLGSRNGTRLDGVSVLHARLRPGSVVEVGRTRLRVELDPGSLRVPLSTQSVFGDMVGSSLAMRQVFALLERVGASESTVLVLGETGTGKEAVAEALHDQSPRRDGPFVVVDCGAIPGALLESELFGHEKGAFTGATGTRQGAFAAAHGGTLLLDEIGELDLELQPKLLRVLERHTIKPVGSDRTQQVDVRVIAATHRDLRAEVNARRFRSDLFFRLAVLEVRLPPLRERSEDFAVLVPHLLRKLGHDPERAELSFLRSPAFLSELARHRWPGNVRELRNYLERCILHQTAVPANLDATPPDSSDSLDALIDPSLPYRESRERWSSQLERRYLTALLARHAGNVSAAARAAGLDRAQFYRLLWRAGLK